MKAVIGNGFFFFIICLLTIVFAHSRQNGSDQTIKLGTELVVLDATVLNKKTGLVLGGVKKEDFILYEDGVKQQITHFSQDELPLSIVLLLDVSCSVGSVFYQIQNGSLQALQRLKPEDEVALMAFDTEAAIIQSFTKDRRLIAERIMNEDEMMSILNNHRQVTPDGTHISDSIYQAAHYLGKASNPSGRRIIIVVTDNEPWERFLIHSKDEVVNELFETGTVVYGLITPSGYKKDTTYKVGKYLPSVIIGTKLANMVRNKGGKVNGYADKTGGVVMQVNENNAQAKLFELIELLRNCYSFGYVSSNQKQDGKFRRIKLKISSEVEKREGEIVIITRRGYYARKSDSRQ